MTNGITIGEIEKAATSFASPTGSQFFALAFAGLFLGCAIVYLLGRWHLVIGWFLQEVTYEGPRRAWRRWRRWRRRRFYRNHLEFFQDYLPPGLPSANVLPGRKERVLQACGRWVETDGDPGDPRIGRILQRIAAIPSALEAMNPMDVTHDLSKYHQFRCDISLKIGKTCNCTEGPTLWYQEKPPRSPDDYLDFLVRAYRYVIRKRDAALRPEHIRLRVLGSLIVYDPEVKRAEEAYKKDRKKHAAWYPAYRSFISPPFPPPPPPPKGGTGQSNRPPKGGTVQSKLIPFPKEG